MTQREIIISGFGGQGAMFTGQLLAYAAMDEGLHVTWIPSYGPEMRGGTANCTVIISDEEIGSPLVRTPYAAIVMNQPSLEKYEPLVAPQGVLVVNTSLTVSEVLRTDLTIINVPANQLAEQLGNIRLSNMVMLGALIAAARLLPLARVEQALVEHMLKGKSKDLITLNLEALRLPLAQAV